MSCYSGWIIQKLMFLFSWYLQHKLLHDTDQIIDITKFRHYMWWYWVWKYIFQFTVHRCSIHKIHCFPQKIHLHSNKRFPRLAQCPLAPLHRQCPALSTQTNNNKKREWIYTFACAFQAYLEMITNSNLKKPTKKNNCRVNHLAVWTTIWKSKKISQINHLHWQVDMNKWRKNIYLIIIYISSHSKEGVHEHLLTEPWQCQAYTKS